MTIVCDTLSPNNGGRLLGWIRSPDGSAFTAVALNTNASKYYVSISESKGLGTLTITNINETDEGLYRCEYQNADIWAHCILVYGELEM